MKTVRDDTGKRYLLLKESSSASLVRDPETGNECYVQNDRLEAVDESPLEAAAATVAEPVRTLLSAVHDDETLGLLIELDERGPLGIRTLLEGYALCESDLHGRLTVLSSAGLVVETTVAGNRGYELTDECQRALDVIRVERDETRTESDQNRTESVPSADRSTDAS